MVVIGDRENVCAMMEGVCLWVQVLIVKYEVPKGELSKEEVRKRDKGINKSTRRRWRGGRRCCCFCCMYPMLT